MMRKFLGALLLLPALACAQILGGTTPSTGFGATPGISGQTTQPSFAAALTTTVVPSIALGSPTATFTRATTATVVDQDQVVRSVLSGEVRFQGARRVRNLLTGTEAMAAGPWASTAGGTGSAATATAGFTAPDGTATAFRIQASRNAGNGGGDFSAWQEAALNTVGQVWIKSNTGSNQDVLTSFTGAGTHVTATPTWQLLSWTNSGPATQFCIGTLGGISTTNSVDVLVWHPQAELTLGQSNANPSEYVSVGVLSAPFQGANVDGVQYFSAYNTNVVQQNLTARSQQYTAGAWSPANVTVAEDVAIAPDGTLTADSLTATLTNACRNSEASGVTAGQMYTASAYFKSTSNVMGFISIDNGGGGVTAYVKGTLTGAGATSTGGAGVAVASSITSVGSSWYRMTLTFIADANSTRFSLGVWNPALGDASGYPGAALGDKIFAWGSQINPGAFAATYVPTVTVAINNNIVETGLAPQIPSATLLGYLAEGLRTNLETQSQTFSSWIPTDITVTPNSLVAPDGTTTGTLLTAGVAGTAGLNSAAITATANVNYAVSMWAKRGNNDWLFLRIGATGASCDNWFNLNTGALGTSTAGGTAVANSRTITAFPAGWYRITSDCAMNGAQTVITPLLVMTSADAVTTRVNNSTVNVWGAQFEDNVSFASSYIPTTTVAVARNADLLTYPSAGNAVVAQGAIYLEQAAILSGQGGADVSINDGGANRVTGLDGPSGGFRWFVASGGVTQADQTVGTSSSGVITKRFGSWNTNLANAAQSGTLGVLDTTVTVPAAFTQIEIGSQFAASNAYAAIRNVRISQTQPTDAQLQGQTGP